MDEVTIELDVCVRRRLLDFLKRETEERNACIMFATHIFDGLGDWATNLVHLRNGTVGCNQPLNEIKQLQVSLRSLVIHNIYTYIHTYTYINTYIHIYIHTYIHKLNLLSVDWIELFVCCWSVCIFIIIIY